MRETQTRYNVNFHSKGKSQLIYKLCVIPMCTLLMYYVVCLLYINSQGVYMRRG